MNTFHPLDSIYTEVIEDKFNSKVQADLYSKKRYLPEWESMLPFFDKDEELKVNYKRVGVKFATVKKHRREGTKWNVEAWSTSADWQRGRSVLDDQGWEAIEGSFKRFLYKGEVWYFEAFEM